MSLPLGTTQGRTVVGSCPSSSFPSSSTSSSSPSCSFSVAAIRARSASPLGISSTSERMIQSPSWISGFWNTAKRASLRSKTSVSYPSQSRRSSRIRVISDLGMRGNTIWVILCSYCWKRSRFCWKWGGFSLSENVLLDSKTKNRSTTESSSRKRISIMSISSLQRRCL